ncbi:MAG TPA: phospholipase D-like domain-containing protein [Oscillatoriaceae cyanobacterium]
MLLSACGANALPMGATPAYFDGQVMSRSHAGVGGLQLFVMPDATDAFLLKAIAGARSSLQIENYMLTDQATIQAVLAAKQRGVAVQVSLEPHPYLGDNPPPVGPNQHTAATLAKAGIQVHWTNPRFTYTHAKFMLVDAKTAFVSSANFTHSGLGGNREYIVQDTQTADVADLERLFQTDYVDGNYTPSAADLVISPVNSRQQLLNLIASARSDIKIQDEEAGDAALNQLLKQKLAQGVHVEAMLAQESALPSAPGEPVQTPGNVITARTWASYGAQVRFQSNPYLHAKAVVVDGTRMYVGSVNLSTNSMDHNREVGILLDAPALVSPVLSAMATDWKNAVPANQPQPAPGPNGLLPRLAL